jgi:hypothetical protein
MSGVTVWGEEVIAWRTRIDMAAPFQFDGIFAWLPGGCAGQAFAEVRSARPHDTREVVMEEQPEQPDQEEKSSGYGRGYGGGGWKKWLLIYLIAGGIIYLIVYLVFFADGGYGG